MTKTIHVAYSAGPSCPKGGYHWINYYPLHIIAQFVLLTLNNNIIGGWVSLRRRLLGVLQLFRERLSEKSACDMISKVHVCSWHCSCQTYFCCFLLALIDRKHTSMASRAIFSDFPEMLRSQGTVILKLPTIPFVIVACALLWQPFSKHLYSLGNILYYTYLTTAQQYCETSCLV